MTALSRRSSPPRRTQTSLKPQTEPAHANGQVLHQVGNYYLNAGAILLVDANQSDRLIIHTAILEVDHETKHARNKKITFTKHDARMEYDQTRALLAVLAGQPTPLLADIAQLEADRDAALQLATEVQAKLVDTEERMHQLEAVLLPLRALLEH